MSGSDGWAAMQNTAWGNADGKTSMTASEDGDQNLALPSCKATATPPIGRSAEEDDDEEDSWCCTTARLGESCRRLCASPFGLLGDILEPRMS